MAKIRDDVVKAMGGKGKANLMGVGKECGKRWRALPEERQSVYKKQAEKLRASYRRTSGQYKKTKGWTNHQKNLKEYRKRKRI